jgi:hypothetical protein
MKRWLTIDAKRLHARRFKSESFSGDKVTLFPFFDREGEVKFVLVVDADSATLRVIRTENADFSFGLTGGIRLSHGAVHRLGSHTLAPLGRLWHFDPWWLLADARFTNTQVVSTLKATNCVERFSREVSNVSYSGDLKRLTGIAHDSNHSETYQSDMLPASPVTSQSSRG